jgi:hypothetical protein
VEVNVNSVPAEESMRAVLNAQGASPPRVRSYDSGSRSKRRRPSSGVMEQARKRRERETKGSLYTVGG